MLSLEHVKIETVDAAAHASQAVDRLIREGSITSRMATSLINDGAYTRELLEHLLAVSEAITRAGLPADELLGEEMSLGIEEIADIARRLEGADISYDSEEYP